MKLDGDMVLGDGYTFLRALDYLEKHPEIELVLLPVRDSFTGRDIVGMHLYRPTVRWTERLDNLFTDSNGLSSDQQAVSGLGLERPVLHCPDPGTSNRSTSASIEESSSLLRSKTRATATYALTSAMYSACGAFGSV